MEVNLPSDCCGMGCRRCVLDLYREELNLTQTGVFQETSNSSQVMSSQTYLSCEITKVERHNNVCCIYTFRLPENYFVQSNFGDHLTAREIVDREVVARSYTLLNSAGVSREFSVLIKHYEAGLMSKAIAEKWVPGCSVEWRGPFSGFQYDMNLYSRILLLAAGTGVVPLFQIARQIVDNEDDETLVKLVFCCRNYDEIPLREEVRQLQQFWNFQSCVYLSDDNQERVVQVKKHNEIVRCERLTTEGLQRELKAFSAGVGDTLILVCGTKGFENDFRNCLIDLGFPPSNVVNY